MRPDKIETQPERLRHIRVEQRPKSQLSSEENQNWAVSYSDMLMVLMSFFIIFFSFNEEHPEKNIIRQISSQMHHQKPETGSLEKSQPHKKTLPVTTENTSLQNISIAFKQNNIELSNGNDQSSLTVHLKDQLYSKRQFVIEGQVKDELKKVLQILLPYKDKLQITLIGHSDQLALSNAGFYLASNLDLSSLRASRALSFAIEEGYDPSQLTIQAATDQSRNTRSLSIKVVSR